ncbi:hypothetical protein GGR53DRAFT_508718 [Hypoxylon sp. FL1150]|nr:hypothetical protein GGR53DRAFT_508718 [Hypoxylon sp. FL1150]
MSPVLSVVLKTEVAMAPVLSQDVNTGDAAVPDGNIGNDLVNGVESEVTTPIKSESDEEFATRATLKEATPEVAKVEVATAEVSTPKVATPEVAGAEVGGAEVATPDQSHRLLPHQWRVPIPEAELQRMASASVSPAQFRSDVPIRDDDGLSVATWHVKTPPQSNHGGSPTVKCSPTPSESASHIEAPPTPGYGSDIGQNIATHMHGPTIETKW